MKIRKLHLKNIGVFDDEIIEFKPCEVKDKAEIHIFTGQNGSGKSTILMALANSFNFIPNTHSGGELAKSKRGLLDAISNLERHNPRQYSFFDRLREFLQAIPESEELRYEEFDYGSKSDEFFKRIRTVESNKQKSYSAAVTADDGTMAKIYECKRCQGVHAGTWAEFENYNHLLSSLDSRGFELDFAVFAFSGYRQILSKRVEAIKEPKTFNPLHQSLEFIKDYSSENQLTINQLIANNISKSGIEFKKGNFEKSQKSENVLKSIQQAIFEITGWQLEFDLRTEPIDLILKLNGEELDFDVLPDGLRSLLSWIADLAGRIDLLKWKDDLPIFEKNLILFLDEIEIHLHPAWQRKVLPVVQKLFKNSQIFISTHSPFVINSVDDAWVYKLELENGKARVAEVVKSEDGHSYGYVLSEIFDIREEFGIEVQKDLAKFKELRNKILASNNGSEKSEKELLKLAKSLALQSEELQTIVQFELRQINKRTGKSLTI